MQCDGIGAVSRRGEGVCVGASRPVSVAAAEGYLRSYADYIDVCSRICDSELGDGGRVPGVATRLQFVVPPVWLGCGRWAAADLGRSGLAGGSTSVGCGDVASRLEVGTTAASSSSRYGSISLGEGKNDCGGSAASCSASEGAESGCDAGASAPDESNVSGRGRHYERNKAKRERRKRTKAGQSFADRCAAESQRAVSEEKAKAKLAEEKLRVPSDSVRVGDQPAVARGAESLDAGARFVPEWRRKAGSGEHFGVFARCSQSVQDELRDSRAKMLVKQNELAVVKAEAERRRVDAMLKTQVVERDVEKRRLCIDVDIRKARVEHSKTIGPGFAETIVSEGLQSSCSVPSLTSGSVSPNSSISVAELNKLNQSLSQAAEDRFELRKAVMEKDQRLEELEKKLSALTVPREAVRGSGRDGYSSWEPAYESPVDY